MTDNTRQEAVERAAHATDYDARLVAEILDASGLIEQLAAERALCDRLAEVMRSKRLLDKGKWIEVNRGFDDILADYDAHRAAERETIEEYGGFGGMTEG